MVRIIGFLVGLGFAGVLLISLVVNLVAYFQSPPEPSAEHEFHRHAKALSLQTDGSARSTASSCSAASRCTRRSAPAAIA